MPAYVVCMCACTCEQATAPLRASSVEGIALDATQIPPPPTTAAGVPVPELVPATGAAAPVVPAVTVKSQAEVDAERLATTRQLLETVRLNRLKMEVHACPLRPATFL